MGHMSQGYERKQRVAVVGGGIGGLTAAYLLKNAYEVTLFEASPRLGGNAYTHTVKDGTKLEAGGAAFFGSGGGSETRGIEPSVSERSSATSSVMMKSAM